MQKKKKCLLSGHRQALCELEMSSMQIILSTRVPKELPKWSTGLHRGQRNPWHLALQSWAILSDWFIFKLQSKRFGNLKVDTSDKNRLFAGCSLFPDILLAVYLQSRRQNKNQPSTVVWCLRVDIFGNGTALHNLPCLKKRKKEKERRKENLHRGESQEHTPLCPSPQTK